MVFPDIGGEGGEETLRVNIVVDASNLVDAIKASRELIEKLKQDLISLREQTGESFKMIGTQMKDAFTAVPGGMSKAEYGRAISTAIAEIKKQEADATQANIRGVQQEIALLRDKEQAEYAVARARMQEAKGDISQQIVIQRQQEAQAIDQVEREMQQQIILAKAEEDAKRKAGREMVQQREREIQQQILLRKELGMGEKTGFLGFLQRLGTVGQTVFGAIFGITAVGALRTVVRLFGEATESGYEFAKAIFQLEVGVRALQRAGMDITLREVYDQLALLKSEFGIFATKDLVAGMAQFSNLIRDLGFTKDQFFELTQATQTLAVVNGRNADEVQRTVALALSSGYTEGLQRLGVSINRVTIAQEAANMGWRNGYTALTEFQRAQATYNLVIRKTAIYQQDLLKYQESAPGKIDALKAATTDYKALVGTGLIPVLGILAGVFSKLLQSMIRSEEKLRENETVWARWINFIRSATNPLKAVIILIQSVQAVWESLVKVITTGDIKGALGTLISGLKDAVASVQGISLGEGILGGDVVQTDAAKAEKEMEKITTAVSNNIDDVEDILEDASERRKELDTDLYRDLEEIQRDSLQRREELERDYQRTLADIQRNNARDIAEANREYAQDLTDLARDVARDEEELRRKQHEKEYDDEKKFQERMRKLRAQYLFDLEEAVRARDAVQIRRLQRRFEFDRNELIIERNNERKQRQEDFKREIEDLRRQAAEKRRELAIEFAQKLEDIAIQRQRELEDAALKHEQDLEDLRRETAEKREERLLAYRQELVDLNRHTSDRLKKIAEAIAQEVGLTGQGAQAVYDVLVAYFGPNGAIDQLFQYYIQAIGNVATETNNALSSIGKRKTESRTPYVSQTEEERNAGGYAYGGSFIADRPTTATFGEKVGVPELVTITPLMSRRNTAYGGGTNQGWNGSLSVMIKLSPGLEGEIVDKALGEFDGLLASLERAR